MSGAAPIFAALIWAVIPGGVVLIWLLFRRGGYKRRLLDRAPGPGWERTGERSVDPATGQLMAVWYNPGTGERAYVREGPPR